MQSDWQIRGRATACTQTGRAFTEGEHFYTLLFRDGDSLRREDLCEEAWSNRNDNIEPFSFWRSKFEPPPPAPPEALPKEDAEGTLRRLMEANKPEYANACYVLAVMLERKRLLRPMESNDDDVLVYEHVKSGETFVLKNPHLTLERIAEVQEEVSGLLAPPPPAPAG